MAVPIRIDSVTFLDRDSAGALLASHPVQSMRTMKRVPQVGLFSRTTKGRDLAIRLVVRRLDPHVRQVRLKGRVHASGIIGHVRAIDVAFRNGATATVTARVQHSLMKATVRKHKVTWNWLARLGGSGPFERVGSSTVTVYTAVAPPNPPWGVRSTQRTRLPWLEALDLSCEWAKGARTVLDIQAAVTRALRRVKGLRYDRDSAAYIKGKLEFRCNEFIEFIPRQQGQNTVACFDVATIVSTFANLVGADLSEDRMSISDGTKKKIGGGATKPLTPLGGKKPKPFLLSTHEVAWMAPGTEDQPVWDASFGFPARPAINMVFTAYRRKLMSGGDDRLDKRCRPIGHPVKRRVAEPTPIATVPPPLVMELIAALGEWKHEWTRVEIVSPDQEWIRSLWVHKAPRMKLMIEATTFSDQARASSALKRMVAAEPGLLVSLPAFRDSAELWDESWANLSLDAARRSTEPATVFYFRQGYWVARVRSVGLVPTSVRNEAAQIAQTLPNVTGPDRSRTLVLRRP